MAYDFYNPDVDPNLTYYNYATNLVQPTITQNITGDTTIITTINGGGGGQATGPSITFSGGTTGMNFVASGNQISLTGVLEEGHGGTGQASYAKGDLLVASAPSVLSKVPVGANGSVLTADSTQATGVRWADPSGGELNVVTVDFTDTPYTVTEDDDVILVNANGGPIAVELPDGLTALQKVYYVKKIDASANPVNINADTGQLIDGAATQSTATQYEAFRLVPDNATGDWSLA